MPQCPDVPFLRHYSYSYQFYGAVPGSNLVVRMVSEINNYDYIADLILSVDGHLEVKVVTSGCAANGSLLRKPLQPV
jgi:Cu2+-containing amine oxidase